MDLINLDLTEKVAIFLREKDWDINVWNTLEKRSKEIIMEAYRKQAHEILDYLEKYQSRRLRGGVDHAGTKDNEEKTDLS